MRKIIIHCAVVFVMFITLCIPSFSVSATSDDDLLAFDLYNDLLLNYGLSGALSGESDLTLVYGYNSSNGVFYTAFWDGPYWYRVDYYDDSFQAYYNGVNSIDIYPECVGHDFCGYFYFDAPDGCIQFLGGLTDSLFISDNYSDVSSFKFVQAGTYEEFGEFILSSNEDTTESTSAGFQLPDSWINGGHTLDTFEPDTFEGVNNDEALGYFEDMQENIEFTPSFESAVGFFWNVVIGFIDSLGAWAYVYLAMFLAIVAFLLGRNL